MRMRGEEGRGGGELTFNSQPPPVKILCVYVSMAAYYLSLGLICCYDFVIIDCKDLTQDVPKNRQKGTLRSYVYLKRALSQSDGKL